MVWDYNSTTSQNSELGHTNWTLKQNFHRHLVVFGQEREGAVLPGRITLCHVHCAVWRLDWWFVVSFLLGQRRKEKKTWAKYQECNHRSLAVGAWWGFWGSDKSSGGWMKALRVPKGVRRVLGFNEVSEGRMRVPPVYWYPFTTKKNFQ